jgi:transposase
MNNSISIDSLFVGLDVAKGKADVCLLHPDGRRVCDCFESSRAGHQKLLAWLDLQRGAWTVHAALESTGPYSRPWCELLHAAGHAVSLLNPLRPKAYAQACGQRNKTDRVDARLLAEFVAQRRPHRWTPPSAALEELKELTRRREDLLTLVQAEKNRLESALCRSVRDSLVRSIRDLKKELARVEDDLDQLLGRQATLRSQEKLLCSIPGIGKVSARKILAELPEACCFQRARQAAAYAGLSPRRHESGKTVRKKGRLSKVGNAVLRKALYMPALVALKHNPLIKAFAQRLRTNGKCEKVILGAAMRKLLLISYGVLKHQKPFNPAYAAT